MKKEKIRFYGGLFFSLTMQITKCLDNYLKMQKNLITCKLHFHFLVVLKTEVIKRFLKNHNDLKLLSTNEVQIWYVKM